MRLTKRVVEVKNWLGLVHYFPRVYGKVDTNYGRAIKMVDKLLDVA